MLALVIVLLVLNFKFNEFRMTVFVNCKFKSHNSCVPTITSHHSLY